MTFRAVSSALLAGSIVLAAGEAPAQDTAASPALQGRMAPSQADDATEVRIKYLHDRLRITAQQEELWDRVAQAIRGNAGVLVPFLKERLRATTAGNAPDLLHAYQALGETQLEGLRRITTAFEPFYAGLSEDQKKIADALLREGAQDATIVPLAPPPFTSALAFPTAAFPVIAYPPPLIAIGPAGTVHSPVGFHHFHSVVTPHLHGGRFHRR